MIDGIGPSSWVILLWQQDVDDKSHAYYDGSSRSSGNGRNDGRNDGGGSGRRDGTSTRGRRTVDIFIYVYVRLGKLKETCLIQAYASYACTFIYIYKSIYIR